MQKQKAEPESGKEPSQLTKRDVPKLKKVFAFSLEEQHHPHQKGNPQPEDSIDDRRDAGAEARSEERRGSERAKALTFWSHQEERMKGNRNPNRIESDQIGMRWRKEGGKRISP
ncbi:hypothetical protein NL676_024477 [Syzygium grande]|nr:hypothetical protein NL676_024477 [Syzygium grande]